MNSPANKFSVETLLLLFFFCGAVHAQGVGMGRSYPSRAVRIVNPSSPGGGGDIMGRLIAMELTKKFGQNFVNDNRPGAANIIATEIVAKASPDGYTLLLGTGGTFVTNVLIYTKLPYSEKDFEPISVLSDAALILTVHPAVPVQTVGELIDLVKKNPGQLSYASFGIGSSSHLAGEMFQQITKTKLVHVPYKGSAPGMIDLLAGHITMAFDTALASMVHVQTKRIRALGVASSKRLSLIADVPTLSETGLSGFEISGWYGLAAPVGTPAVIIGKLHGEIVKALKLPEVQRRISELGAEVVGNTPQEFRAKIASELKQFSPVVKLANIKAE